MVLHVSENRNFLVIDDCTQQEYNQILISYTKQAKNAKFDQRVKRGFWDGNIKFVKGKYLPAGTYSYLQRLCKEFGFSCKINGIDISKGVGESDSIKSLVLFIEVYKIVSESDERFAHFLNS